VKAFTPPQFRGGQYKLLKYLCDYIRYPAEAYEKGIQGRVFITFVVETDGSISEAKVLRSPHPLLSAEALRVVRQMPKWKPGKIHNRSERVQFNLPVKFSLN
jgi:TonB family protein